MRRRTRALLATVGVTAATLVATGVVFGQPASAHTPHTLLAREKFTKTFQQDVGEKGMSIGDRFTFTSEVRDLKGALLGIGAGDCVLLSGTSESDGQYNCVQTYHLAGGDFVTSGFFDFAQKINKWAIVGGTGRYRAATGQADFTTLSADTFADTFRIKY
jgi:hypothetical protein